MRPSKPLIYGIGTDIAAIPRFRTLYERYGEAAGRRILAEEEQAAFQAASDKARFLAKRFAAKEAFSKAVGTGLRGEVKMRAISLRHNALGRPELAFSEALAAWLERQGVGHVHVSLSDDAGLVSAFAVAETA